VPKIGTDIGKLLQDGAMHRDNDFIPPAMKDAVIAKTPFVGSGEAAEVTFTVAGKPGTYPYICTFAGHYQARIKARSSLDEPTRPWSAVPKGRRSAGFPAV
jgi:azurin